MPHTRQQIEKLKEAKTKKEKEWYSVPSNQQKKQLANKLQYERKKLKQEQEKTVSSKLQRTVRKLKESPSEQVSP